MVVLGRSIDAFILFVPQAELLGGGIAHGTVLHRHDGCAGMAGRLNLRNDVHTALPGIAQQFNKLAAGEVTVGTLRQVIGITVTVKYLSQIALLVEGSATA